MVASPSAPENAAPSRLTPEERELAHEVLRSLRKILRKVAAHSKHLSGHVGMTLPQLMCLKAIGEFEEEGTKEITVAAVSKRVQLSPATVSRIIERLVRVELVSRERTAKDRRKVCLSLTTSGIERFQSLPTPLQERFVERLIALPDEERQALLTALQRISGLMEADTIQAAPVLLADDSEGWDHWEHHEEQEE